MSQYFDKKDLFLSPTVTQYGSHMVMSNVHKETKTKYWNIDTRFRDDYTEYTKNAPTSYTISLPQRINDVKSISINSAEIPLSYYNICSSFENNVLKITKNNIEYILVVSDNIYTSSTLISEINSKLSTLGLTTLTFDISNNFSYFKSSADTYTINFAVKTSNTCSGATNLTADFDKYNLKMKLGWILGFRKIEYVVTNALQLKSENFIDLNGLRYMYLVLDEFSNGNQNSFISPLSGSILNKNIMAKIIMNSIYFSYGTILFASYSNGSLISDNRSYSGKVDLQRLNIQLVNEYGIPVNLNGLDFSFILKIEYE